jgi:hypothetical protein
MRVDSRNESMHRVRRAPRFAESGSPDSAYIADIYDHIGFLGDFQRQIATMPDGAKVKFTIKR